MFRYNMFCCLIIIKFIMYIINWYSIIIMLMKCFLRVCFYNYVIIEAMLFCCLFDGFVKIFWDVSFVFDIF